MIVRAIFAIVIGVLTTALLEYFVVFTPHLDVLIGIAVGLLVFFNSDRLVG
jgi:hypothetical protein